MKQFEKLGDIACLFHSIELQISSACRQQKHIEDLKKGDVL